MAIHISAETTIGRPRAEVAAFVMDPANDTAWIGGITESRSVTEGPIGVGSKVARTAKFLGRELNYVNEVTSIEEGRLLAMKAGRPFPMEVRYEFEDSGEGTLARVRVSGEGSGFFRVAAPLLAPMVRRNMSGDLRRLKSLLEGSHG